MLFLRCCILLATLFLIEKANAQVLALPQEDVMPAYKGGTEEMYRFIAEHLDYPDSALHKGITGRVFAEFVVDSLGNMTNIRVRQGIGEGCDEEAIRVLTLMDKTKPWTPGYHKGKAVSVTFTLPVSFVITRKKKKG